MKLQPIGDRLIIEIVEIEETTASGLVLPDSAKEPSTTGTVAAVGEKVESIKTGDKVIFPPNAGLPITGHDGYRLFDISQIIAIDRG